ncbi:MAG: sulfite exporter TauE/SafE family protein [Chloroflexi bacterium]|nr:sulfite exporter TauE/SafE family protein [Chloroflexota bacterium]MBT5627384.1 sulfite exporter TauE/SafE family protein [Chloroflexota bacterium]
MPIDATSAVSTLALTGAELSGVQLTGLAIMSLIVGIVGGIVGIALGVVRLPVMTAIGVDPLLAASTNLFVSVLGSLAGSWPAILQHRIVYRVVLVIGIPAIGGSFVGGLYADLVSRTVLLTIVALLLVWSAVMMITRAMGELRSKKVSAEDTDPSAGRGDLNTKTVARESFVGFGIGLIGGAVGLALGVLRMPALIHVLKMKPSLAAGTNLALTILVGSSGFTGHLIRGRVDWLLVAAIGVPAMVGMFAGARMGGDVDSRKLRLVVGIVLLAVSPLVFFDAFWG